mmetsp:Transcript_9929/g.23153  ORF Transcript_9929/g.23153 Transcript_9929/m.23153 type:complete len:172 (-) Transcript_9929:91-606(-)
MTRRWRALSCTVARCRRCRVGLGASFPEHLTYRSGLDNEVIDLMVSLLDDGTWPEALSSTLLEQHTKRYWKLHLWHEQAVRRQLDQPTVGAKPPVRFSSFSDMDGYAGTVPSGNYLASVCKDYSESIGPYLDKEVKKRGAEMTGLNALLEYICKLCMGSSCPGKWRNCCID